LSRIQREYVESGRIAFEEWSHLGLGLRFRAAAMGVPFLPSLTMLGSSLMDVGGSKTVECPYTGRTLHAVPALFPDIALVHVHRARRRDQAARRRGCDRLPGALRLRAAQLCGLSGAVPGKRAPRRRRTRADADVVSCTANELLAVMGARALEDDTTVFAGVGAPMMAA